MKRFFSLLLVLFGLSTFVLSAQSYAIKSDKPAWKNPVDAHYLTGAVPVVDGKVTFSRDVQLPEKVLTDQQGAYVAAKHFIGQYFNHKEVNTRKNLERDSANYQLKVGINEYIIFSSSTFVLDRSQMIYTLEIRIDGKVAHVTMSDISYYYEEDRKPEKYEAEEWITDENAITKNGKKFIYGHGKFRTKTIDTFDNICNGLHEQIWKQFAK